MCEEPQQEQVMEVVEDTRGFFQERIDAALTRLDIKASEQTSLYLRELLSRGTHSVIATPDQPIVTQLASALDETQPRERRQKLQETGDAALYTCGFFQEHIQGRGMSVDYYATMGGRAYQSAAVLPGPHRSVFGELAERFSGFAQVLDEVRETTMLRTPQDIVRLYDRWRRTKSPRLAERLQEEGVFPGEGALFGSDDGTLH